MKAMNLKKVMNVKKIDFNSSGKYVRLKLKEIKGDRRKLLASFTIIILIITSFYGVVTVNPGIINIRQEIPADIASDILPSKSVRNIPLDINKPLVVEEGKPFLTIISTPVALWYENGNRNVRPLLVYSSSGPSQSVENYLNTMRSTDVTTVGDFSTSYVGNSLPTVEFTGDYSHISSSMASYYWNSSDGAIIVKDDTEGYNLAVSLSSAASYLDIPIIVTDKITSEVAKTLMHLGVKYTIVVGDVAGYGKVLRFKNSDDINDFMITLINERLKKSPEYITVTNPDDAIRPTVVEEKIVLDAKGIIKNNEVKPYPGAPPVSTEGPFYYFDIPQDYNFTNLIIDLRMDISEATGKPLSPLLSNDADSSGERIYLTEGVDINNDKTLTDDDYVELFCGSPGYDIIRDGNQKPTTAWFYTEMPVINNTGKHAVQMMAKLPTDPDQQAPFTIKIIAQKLAMPDDSDTYIYPQVKDLSSMAGYVSAYHSGITLAKTSFNVYRGQNFSAIKGYPGATAAGAVASNKKAVQVKEAINSLIGKINKKHINGTSDWKNLAEKYDSMPPKNRISVGFLADTLMVPQFYHKTSQGGGMEGYGMPGDGYYSDIDMNAPVDMSTDPTDYSGSVSFELSVGRIIGDDIQDVSALEARTFFYDSYIDNVQVNNDPMIFDLKEYGLSYSWKDNAITTVGTELPVTLSRTTAAKLTHSWERAGFYTTDAMGILALDGNRRSRRQFSYSLYESANFIFFGVHGFSYWYVPSAAEGGRFLPYTGGGSAYDVAHVKYMGFGPSVIYGSSCVTGKIDSLNPNNAISLAFIHAGVNAYIGASRSSWGAVVYVPDSSESESLGDLLGMYMYSHLSGYIYNKDGGLIKGLSPDVSDTSVGTALMLAKNEYVVKSGYDNGGSNSDTLNEFNLIGDPAFNPYEPNHG